MGPLPMVRMYVKTVTYGVGDMALKSYTPAPTQKPGRCDSVSVISAI